MVTVRAPPDHVCSARGSSWPISEMTVAGRGGRFRGSTRRQRDATDHHRCDSLTQASNWPRWCPVSKQVLPWRSLNSAPLSSVPPRQLGSLAGLEHGRTIPFSDMRREKMMQRSNVTRGAGVVEYLAGLFRPYAREPHHLAPFLSFVGDELSEVSGRARKHLGTQVGKPRLHHRIG